MVRLFSNAGLIRTALLASVALVAPAMAQKNAQVQPARDFEIESRHATSIPVRDMPTIDVEPPFPHVEHEPLKRPLPAYMGTTPAGPDRVAQLAPRALGATPLVGLNFLGEGDCGPQGCVSPSDSEGNIGLTQYVEFVNSGFAVYDKKTGALVAGPTAGHVLFQALGSNNDCANTDDGDPIVQYDKAANRWILSQFSVAFAFQSGTQTHPTSECIAVSQTADATGAYNVYQFKYNNFNDYPKIGVWSDKWLVNYNMFQLTPNPGNAGNLVGDEMCALDRASMLAGKPANQACAAPNPNELTLLPADLDGSNAPPVNEHGFFIGLGTPPCLTCAALPSLHMFTVSSVTFSTGSITLNGPISIPIPSFTFACGSSAPNDNTAPHSVCIPQKDGGGQLLDSLGERLMYRLAYRNMGTFDTVLATHTVDVSGTGNGQTGIRWYEIHNLGGTPTLFQSGTYAPDANYRWVPSAAMDQSGDIAIGYSVASSSLDPSIYFSTRAAGDPPGTLGNETLILTGPGAQTGINRWGDYTAMTVDPVDDCTMWYVNQFMPSSQFPNWATEIANFQMAGCGVSQLAITSAPGSAQAGVVFSITVKAEGGGQTVPNYRGTVHFTSSDSAALLPADYTFTAADAGVHTFTVTLVSLGSQTITVADANNSIVVAAGQATIPVGPGPASQLAVSAASPQMAGAAFTFTVTAKDQFGNTATGYAGTVHFTSSDLQAVLPGDSTLTSGAKSFGATLKTAGNQTIIATDTVNSTLAGSANITVNAAAASQFVFVAPGTAKAGTAFSFRLTAEDPFGNVATSYRGTVTFTSTDGFATFPAAYTFVAGDNGMHVFSATLATSGGQTLTATDAAHSIAKTSGTITVGTTDPALHAVARQIRIFRATPPVIAGSFTDDDTGETGSNLTASIGWGDGSPPDPNAAIVHVGGLPNLFNVLGSHTYKIKGRFTVTVTISDSAGGSVQVNSTAQFGPRTFAF